MEKLYFNICDLALKSVLLPILWCFFLNIYPYSSLPVILRNFSSSIFIVFSDRDQISGSFEATLCKNQNHITEQRRKTCSMLLCYSFSYIQIKPKQDQGAKSGFLKKIMFEQTLHKGLYTKSHKTCVQCHWSLCQLSIYCHSALDFPLITCPVIRS